MNARRLLEWGGLAAGIVLVAFGIGAIAMGVDGRSAPSATASSRSRSSSATRSDPAVAEHASKWVGDQVRTGDQARAFALVMREHTLGSTDDLTYAQMGRYQVGVEAGRPGGDQRRGGGREGRGRRSRSRTAPATIWVTETGLTTALNTSYMAERLALFGVVVGVALLLTGIGLMILALAVLGGRLRERPAGAMRHEAAVAGH